MCKILSFIDYLNIIINLNKNFKICRVYYVQESNQLLLSQYDALSLLYCENIIIDTDCLLNSTDCNASSGAV